MPRERDEWGSWRGPRVVCWFLFLMQRNGISCHLEYKIFKIHRKRNLGILTEIFIVFTPVHILIVFCIYLIIYMLVLISLQVHKFPNIANFRWFRWKIGQGLPEAADDTCTENKGISSPLMIEWDTVWTELRLIHFVNQAKVWHLQ